VSPRPGFKFFLFGLFLLIIAMPAHAFAYGDPSGGFLFQVLTPIVALIWGVWLAFAHSIHKFAAKIIAKVRGTTPEETTEEQSEVIAP
jgi:hypothetical protein